MELFIMRSGSAAPTTAHLFELRQKAVAAVCYRNRTHGLTRYCRCALLLSDSDNHISRTERLTLKNVMPLPPQSRPAVSTRRFWLNVPQSPACVRVSCLARTAAATSSATQISPRARAVLMSYAPGLNLASRFMLIRPCMPPCGASTATTAHWDMSF
ncbi:hypothetical protein BJV78DRAFT_1226487 [Lactifluus subvellereus]|nr:hypothetical protein BJV78DRAFT_1226487 [Lactifluus subvellereus]